MRRYLVVVVVVALVAGAAGAGITAAVLGEGDKVPAGYTFHKYGNQSSVRALGIECTPSTFGMGNAAGLHCYRLNRFHGSYNVWLSVQELFVSHAGKTAQTVFYRRQPEKLPSFGGCSASEPRVRPPEILVGCGDGAFGFQRIRWSAWTTSRAVGIGAAYANLCAPDCAAGDFKHYRVSLLLRRPRTCSNGAREFTVLSWYPIGSSSPKGGRAGTRRSPWGLGRVRCP